MKTIFRALAVVAALSAAPATADVVLKGDLEYSDFFGNCRINLKYEGTPARVTGVYDVELPAHRSVCAFKMRPSSAASWNCASDIGLKYVCEDIRAVTVRGMRCLDENDEAISCGAVSSDGPAVVSPDLKTGGSHVIFAALNDDGRLGSCEISVAVASPYEDGYTTLDYVVNANGEAKADECEARFSNGGGASSSCSGVFDHTYSCAQVEAVTASAPTCFDDDDKERPCGPITSEALGIKGLAVAK